MLLVILMLGALMSCNSSGGGCKPVSSVGESTDPARLNLYVGNQSFEIDPVLIEVYIDDQPVVCQEFQVEDQHNWILFELQVAPGSHTLRAVGNNGAAEIEQLFDVNLEHWAVVDFWFYPDDPPQRLGFGIQDTPIVFL